jgi:hypothetical protein
MKLAVAALVATAACSSHTPPAADQVSTTDAAQLLINRNWLDVMPETKHDRLHVYRFVPSMGGGVFQDRTIFKGTFELFKFTVDKDKIHFDLPETDDEVTSRFKIEKVKGPKPFDLKLTISDDPRGPHIYYGVRAETDFASDDSLMRVIDQRAGEDASNASR